MIKKTTRTGPCEHCSPKAAHQSVLLLEFEKGPSIQLCEEHCEKFVQKLKEHFS